jgi:hypothetical protein
MSPAAPVKPHHAKVSLVVRTTSGQFEDEFALSSKVEHLLRETEKRLNLAHGHGISYTVTRQRGNVVMNPAERLSEYELVDGDTILIQSSQAQDG